MNEKDLDSIRKRLFPETEEKKGEEEIEKVSFDDLFALKEEEPKPPPKAGVMPEETAPEPLPLSEEERIRLNLKQIKRLIAEYRWWLAEAEKRVVDLRAKLAGLETEYKALVGDGSSVSPAPDEKARESVGGEKPPAGKPERSTSPGRRASSVWMDADRIDLEEAAWRVITEQGKSLPVWRIASAIRRKGFTGEFTESSLGAEVGKSGRLNFTGEGHIYIK